MRVDCSVRVELEAQLPVQFAHPALRRGHCGAGQLRSFCRPNSGRPPFASRGPPVRRADRRAQRARRHSCVRGKSCDWWALSIVDAVLGLQKKNRFARPQFSLTEELAPGEKPLKSGWKRKYTDPKMCKSQNRKKT